VRGKPTVSYKSLILVTKIRVYSKNAGSKEFGDYPISTSLCPLHTWNKTEHLKFVFIANFQARFLSEKFEILKHKIKNDYLNNFLFYYSNL